LQTKNPPFTQGLSVLFFSANDLTKVSFSISNPPKRPDGWTAVTVTILL